MVSASSKIQEIVQSIPVNVLQKPLEKITVKEIMENSELSRQTFYQVFDSTEDVLEYYMDTLFLEYLGRSKVEVIDNLCDAAKLFFQFFNENEFFVEALTQNKKTCILQKKCQEYLQNEHFLKFTQAGIHNPQEKTFASAFITAGLVGTLVCWFKSGKIISSEDLAHLVCRITKMEE